MSSTPLQQIVNNIALIGSAHSHAHFISHTTQIPVMNAEQDLCNIIAKYSEYHNSIDILDRLIQKAQELRDTEKARERLKWHPCISFLREFSADGQSDLHTFHSKALPLIESFNVQSSSCTYDDQRNVKMAATVRFTPCNNKAFDLLYRYSRTSKSPKGHTIAFTLSVAEAFNKPNELLKFRMNSTSSYPRSVYESDDDSSEEELDHFSLDEDIMVALLDFFQFVELDAVEIMQAILALPYHEDEWMIDDRIVELLFDTEEADS